MPAAVTPIRPALATAEVTRWRVLLDPVGEYRSTSWERLFEEFGRVVPFRGEKHPGWSAAVFEGDQRGKDFVLRVTAAVLDYDGTASINRALETWTGCFGLLHTSKKHRDDAPRFRVILPLRRSVSAFEWDILWQRVQDHCDGASDPAAKDASRFWYTPGVIEGGEFQTIALEGSALDPDVWLRKAPKTAPAIYAAPDGYRPPADPASIEERARRYVAKMPEAISGQNGHGTTWKVAITCARGFALDQAATLRILREWNARCQPQWTEKELLHKANDAAEANVPRSYLLRDRPGWSPPEQYFSPDRIGEHEFDEDGVEIDPEPDSGRDEVPDDPEAAPKEESAGVRTMSELLADVLERAKSGQRNPGVSTCHYKLDHMLAGFRPGMITVLGARTSFGKSSYAIMVVDEALRRGDGVLFVSVEDSQITYGQRFMARRARVNAYRLRANESTPDELARMESQALRAEHLPFFVDAIGKPAEWIAQTIRQECKKRKIKLVVLDYLQRVRSLRKTQDKRTEITGSMELIANAIKENDAAGLVLSQLKRLDGGVDKEPHMSDLKESGDIENMAEAVVLGWLTEDKGNDSEEPIRRRYFKVEKNKDGPVDTRAIDVGFDIATAGFKIAQGQVFHHEAEELGDFAEDRYP